MPVKATRSASCASIALVGLLTQRLILQPQIELNVYSKGDPARLVGAGFSDIDTGLRLRYPIRPEIRGPSGRRL
jgi:uncharacterized protein involved in copper resistance